MKRVAILGGARIPFARANTAYQEFDNQDMLTAAFKALVDRFGLKNQRIGEVAAGALSLGRSATSVRERRTRSARPVLTSRNTMISFSYLRIDT